MIENYQVYVSYTQIQGAFMRTTTVVSRRLILIYKRSIDKEIIKENICATGSQ
jgi:hypothetical protein